MTDLPEEVDLDPEFESNDTSTTSYINVNGTAGNQTYFAPYEVPVEIVVLLSLFYGAISLVAVLGNSLVICIVLTSRRMQTVTNYFIANLALADVVIGLFSIPFQFQAALLQRWNMPEFMCPFCPFFQNVSVNASIFTLTAIAVDRYKAIVYPLSNHASKQRTKIILACIWLASVSLAIPQAVAFRVVLMDGNTVPQCLPVNVSMGFFKAYMFALCFVQYFVPLVLISFAYIRISVVLWGSKMPGAAQDARDELVLKNKKKVVKVLILVVSLFTLAWLPLQGYYVAQEIFPNINEYKYINILWFCAHWLAMSNSCYNPFIYLICHDKFQKEFRNRFKCLFKPAPGMEDSRGDMNRHVLAAANNAAERRQRLRAMPQHRLQHYNNVQDSGPLSDPRKSIPSSAGVVEDEMKQKPPQQQQQQLSLENSNARPKPFVDTEEEWN